MIQGTYWIRVEKGGSWTARQVAAEIHETQGYGKLMAHKEMKEWFVSHYRLGSLIASDKTKKAAISKAMHILSGFSDEEYSKLIHKRFLKHGYLND